MQAFVMFYNYAEDDRDDILMHIKKLLKRYFTEQDVQDLVNDLTVCIIGLIHTYTPCPGIRKLQHGVYYLPADVVHTAHLSHLSGKKEDRSETTA